MSEELPDWGRLEKALLAETKHGFTNLVGKQYIFNQFLQISLSQPPQCLSNAEIRQWHEMANRFAEYPQLTGEQREQLIAQTRWFLFQMQQSCKKKEIGQPHDQENSDQDIKRLKEQQKQKLQNYKDIENFQEEKQNYQVEISLASPQNGANSNYALDQSIDQISGLGKKAAEQLAKLGLYTVGDLLYYYPRDHIDHQTQVNIRDLNPGETVTIVGTVKRCTCFSSPRNKKLNILELVLSDRTGQIKLNRFFPGNYSVRWARNAKTTLSSRSNGSSFGVSQKR